MPQHNPVSPVEIDNRLPHKTTPNCGFMLTRSIAIHLLCPYFPSCVFTFYTIYHGIVNILK